MIWNILSKKYAFLQKKKHFFHTFYWIFHVIKPNVSIFYREVLKQPVHWNLFYFISPWQQPHVCVAKVEINSARWPLYISLRVVKALSCFVTSTKHANCCVRSRASYSFVYWPLVTDVNNFMRSLKNITRSTGKFMFSNSIAIAKLLVYCNSRCYHYYWTTQPDEFGSLSTKQSHFTLTVYRRDKYPGLDSFANKYKRPSVRYFD